MGNGVLPPAAHADEPAIHPTPAAQDDEPAVTATPSARRNVTPAALIDEPAVGATPTLHLSRSNKTGYRGVTPTNRGLFVAKAYGSYLGVFSTAAEAAVAYARHVETLEREAEDGGASGDDAPRPQAPSRFFTSKERTRFLDAARRAGWADVQAISAHV